MRRKYASTLFVTILAASSLLLGCGEEATGTSVDNAKGDELRPYVLPSEIRAEYQSVCGCDTVEANYQLCSLQAQNERSYKSLVESLVWDQSYQEMLDEEAKVKEACSLVDESMRPDFCDSELITHSGALTSTLDVSMAKYLDLRGRLNKLSATDQEKFRQGVLALFQQALSEYQSSFSERDKLEAIHYERLLGMAVAALKL